VPVVMMPKVRSKFQPQLTQIEETCAFSIARHVCVLVTQEVTFSTEMNKNTRPKSPVLRNGCNGTGDYESPSANSSVVQLCQPTELNLSKQCISDLSCLRCSWFPGGGQGSLSHLDKLWNKCQQPA
jgi:hypothetical protein